MGTIMNEVIIRSLSKILEICNKTIGFDLSTKYDGKEIKISNEINENK